MLPMSQRAESVAAVRRIGWWLLAATVLLIVYGSLFPFRFEPDERSIGRIVLDLSFQRASRGDLVANLLLYAPLGFCVALIVAGPRRWLLALSAAVALGLLLSVSIEVLQASSASRVSSLTDVVLNGIGTFAGALAGVVGAKRVAALRLSGVERGNAALPAIVVLLLWLGFRLAPFVPTIDWQKYKDAVKPLLIDPQFGPLAVFGYLAGWLVVAYTLPCVAQPAKAWRLFLLLAAGVLAGRVVIVDKAVSPSEVLALALCIPFAPLLASLGDKRKVAALVALTVAAITLQGLEPFAFSTEARSFSWVPFRSSLTGGLEIGYTVLFEKAFWYLSLVWLLTRVGATLAAAALAAVALLSGIEIAQIWLPGRSPEITDPVLALGLAWLLRVLAIPLRS